MYVTNICMRVMSTMHTNVVLMSPNINIDIVIPIIIGIFPSLPSTVEAPLLAGIIPSVALLLSNIISVVVAVLVTRYCCNSSSQKSFPPKHNDVYEQVEGSDAHKDIPMTTSPAYGPVIQK